tara:strand:+ start:1578 stop:2009 length:432 start_codon:yes stop_codon:yes gene_type:complete
MYKIIIMDHEFFEISQIKQNNKYNLGEEMAQKVFINEADDNEYVSDYYSKLDYNLHDNENKLVLHMLIQNQDIQNVFNYLKQQQFYCHMDDLTLYIYTRRLCSKPIKKSEIKKILKMKQKLQNLMAVDPMPKIIKKQKSFLYF